MLEARTLFRISRLIGSRMGGVPGLAAVLACVVVASSSTAAMAAETIGPTYPIAEPDMLQEIQAKLQAMQRSGELARKQEEGQKRAQAYLENPPPIEGVSPTTAPRTFYFDPSITVNRDYRTPTGELVMKAGTRFNPLSATAWPRPWIFLDARHNDHVRRALALQQQYGGRAKLILTGGSWMSLSKSLGYQVYYDQQGVLVRKFGIRQVPATVIQEGMRLRIDEIKS
jgi:conjugal transfer pilus assembly protein TraW